MHGEHNCDLTRLIAPSGTIILTFELQAFAREFLLQIFMKLNQYPLIISDPEGVVQRDLHNMDPEYLEYKFSYGNELSSKFLFVEYMLYPVYPTTAPCTERQL